jgi:hypothetical protein
MSSMSKLTLLSVRAAVAVKSINPVIPGEPRMRRGKGTQVLIKHAVPAIVTRFFDTEYV